MNDNDFAFVEETRREMMDMTGEPDELIVRACMVSGMSAEEYERAELIVRACMVSGASAEEYERALRGFLDRMEDESRRICNEIKLKEGERACSR